MLKMLIYIYKHGRWFEKEKGDLKNIIEKSTDISVDLAIEAIKK